MKRALAAALLVLALPARGKQPPPVLEQEQRHPSGAFTFRLPKDWTVTHGPGGLIEAVRGDLSVRFLWRQEQFGTDVAHTDCMEQRPLSAREAFARISYDHDFIGGALGDRHVLDSALNLTYDEPVRGHKAWHERAITVTGHGETLCAVSFAPKSVGKTARRLLDAILESLTFPPPAAP